LINRVLQFIDEYNLRHKKVIVGFSGGYDSMCLLDILSKIKDNCGLTVIAAHYNHNWRGKKAKEEQIACGRFCESKGIDFYTETAENNVKKTETIARELRYKFFERAFEKYNADVVFTAHNYNDNAETILYRIIKGTGIVGLKGILPNRGIYYRPLLSIKRAEIEQYCKDNNLTPNVDDSNDDNIHKRNLIRNEILPLLKQINPDVLSALNNLGEIAQTENGIIDEYIGTVNKDLFLEEKIKTPVYKTLSHNLKKKIIYNYIYNSTIDYSKEFIDNLVKFIEETLSLNKPSKCSLDSENWLYVDKNIIEIISQQNKNQKVLPINKMGEYSFNDYTFSINTASEFKKQPDETSAIIDLSSVNINELCIRTRRDGDIIQPLGSNGHMKLKKYLMSKNIPQHERDNLLLLADNNEILWVAGVGLSDKIKTVNKPTHSIKVERK